MHSPPRQALAHQAAGNNGAADATRSRRYLSNKRRSLGTVIGGPTAPGGAKAAAPSPSAAACVVLMLLLLVAPASSLFPSGKDAVEEVAVGIYVLNLGAVDPLGGTFEVDFYLYFTSDNYYGIDLDKVQGYFPNAVKGLTAWQVEKFPGRENTTSQYRVQSKFYFTVDNSLFPFERHRLGIFIEDFSKTSSHFFYSADNATSGISPAIHFPGFDRTSLKRTMSVDNFTYPFRPEEEPKVFSRVTFEMDLIRPFSNAIMKGVLPPFFLLLVLSFNTLLPVRHITNRITVAGTVLVSAVMYHANLENQTPPTGKLSVADEIMISTYFLVTFNFSCAIMVLLLADRNANEEAQDVQWMCIVVQWFCTPLTFVFSLFLGQPSFLIVMIVAAHLAVITYLMRQLPFLRKMKKWLDFGLSEDITEGVPHGRNSDEDVHTSLLDERGLQPGDCEELRPLGAGAAAAATLNRRSNSNSTGYDST